MYQCKKNIFLICLLVMSFLIMGTQAFAISQAPIIQIDVLSKDTSSPLLAVTITPPENQYIYAFDDTYALPLRVSLSTALQVRYPESQAQQDILDPKQQVRVYAKPTTFFVILPKSMWDTSIEMQLSMLLCSPTACTPFRENYTVEIPPTAPSLATSSFVEAYKNATQQTTSLVAANTKIALQASTVPKIQGWGQAVGDTSPIPVKPEQSSQTAWKFTPQEANTIFTPTNLWPAMLLGLLAGLILNVMPCVLPVITIKLTALLNTAATTDPKLAQRTFREHNAFFAIGIVAYFLVLAVFMGLTGLAWGALFQLVPVVFGLLIIVFSLSLSMFGVFTLPAPQIKESASQSATWQSFLTGFFVTLLATPCSGPLLGGVLGWAATQSLASLVMVFIATGLGMASPYLMLAMFPSTVRFLPKPGAWTRIFEYCVGFLLLLTSLYLLSILPEALLFPSLVALIVIAFALWLWGQWGYLAPMKQQVITGFCSVALMIAAIVFVFMPEEAEYQVQAYSEQHFKDTLGKRPVMLIFTADWCPSCKVLEQTVLTPDALATWEREYAITIFKVDITEYKPKDMELLRALNSISIPLVAIFPQGEKADSPYILRDFFTQTTVTEVLQTVQNLE